jgi:two-component system, OmpR family, manganese sensing sensor histidine kinase
MALGTGLSPINNKAIRRLIAANLLVVILVLLTFCAAVYGFSASQLYSELKQRIAMFNGSLISSIDEGEIEPDIFTSTRTEQTAVPLSRMKLEWYSTDGKLLKEMGAVTSHIPFSALASYQRQSDPPALALTTPAIVRGKLMGFLRTFESFAVSDQELGRLQTGLVVGVLIALVMSALGILWLTQLSLKPLDEAFLKLKRFTDHASHELRSPLAAIQTNIEFVLKRSSGIEPTFRERLLTVQNTVKQMTTLTNELLLLSKADRNDRAVTFDSVNIGQLTEEVLAIVEPMAGKKSIELELAQKKKPVVLGNREELRSIFNNILQNAIEYTPAKGKVTVTVDESEGVALVEITDTGIGIAAGDIEKIFDRFWRADRARTARAGGAGLGLSIAKTFAEQHQGSIAVKSMLDEGSIFTIRIPCSRN